MDEPLKNIALLIDADNATARGIDPVLTVLAELGQVNIRRAYGNWAKPALSKWSEITHRFGLQPMQQFDLTKGKNATDMAMTIDAIDLLFRGKVDGFGIMSSDSDFTPLVTRLRQDGLVVFGFGSAKAPKAFQTACTRYIDVDQLIKNEAAEEPPEPAEGPSAKDDYQELIASSARPGKLPSATRTGLLCSPKSATSPATGRGSTCATTASSACPTCSAPTNTSRSRRATGIFTSSACASGTFAWLCR
jgi:uncharacterized protein (TIGR00288 family)